MSFHEILKHYSYNELVKVYSQAHRVKEVDMQDWQVAMKDHGDKNDPLERIRINQTLEELGEALPILRTSIIFKNMLELGRVEGFDKSKALKLYLDNQRLKETMPKADFKDLQHKAQTLVHNFIEFLGVTDLSQLK